MKDAVLVHHQGSWVAYITLQDGRAAPFSLRQNLTPEEARSINALHRYFIKKGPNLGPWLVKGQVNDAISCEDV